MIPQDPVILFSFINTKLRDSGASLEELCRALDADPAQVLEKLTAAGFTYHEEKRRFER